jgi:hypothetical protein
MSQGAAMKLTKEFAQKVLSVVDAGLVAGVGRPVPGQMCVEAAVNYAMGKPHGDEPDCVSPALRRLKIKLNDSRWSSNVARTKGLRRLAIAQLGSAGLLDEKEFAHRCAVLAIQVAVPFALRAAANMKGNGAFREKLLAAAEKCEQETTRERAIEAKDAAVHAYGAADAADAAAYAAYAAAYAAYAAAVHAYAAADAADAAAYAADAAADAAAYAADAAADAADAADAAAYAARDSFLADFCECVVQILIDMKAPGCKYLYLTEIAA